MTPEELARELTKRGKRWTFTLNNYTEGQIGMIKQLMDTILGFLIIGKELAPSTGTPHLQGYLETKKRMTGRALKKLMPDSTVLISANGSADQNISYCMKDGNTISFGKAMTQGKRTDLESMREMIVSGATEIDLAEANFTNWCRYNRSFERYRHMISETKRDWFPEIYVLWGGTGLGKTKKVYEDNDHNDIWTWNGNHQFYQGYNMQSVCLFDDFYGDINLGYMLKLCDRYPMIVNIKNGQCNWQPKKIYFTSNEDPRGWWPDDGPAKRAAFFRRIRENGGIIHFDELQSSNED